MMEISHVFNITRQQNCWQFPKKTRPKKSMRMSLSRARQSWALTAFGECPVSQILRLGIKPQDFNLKDSRSSYEQCTVIDTWLVSLRFPFFHEGSNSMKGVWVCASLWLNNPSADSKEVCSCCVYGPWMASSNSPGRVSAELLSWTESIQAKPPPVTQALFTKII